MDFLLCCPRGPDHQGRHAVPEAESAADGPPWTAGAEKDRKRRNWPRGFTGSAEDNQRSEPNGERRSRKELGAEEETNFSERAFNRMQIVGNWLCALCGAE